MAVDTRSLVYLIDPFWQGENINGKPLLGGYMEVYVAGTDTKYITWSDWDGARHPFRIPLKSDGRACILVEPQYTYDCYLYDSFGNLACSRLNVSPDIGGDVSVSGLTQVYHDETISGNGTPYEPLGIVSGGKTYEGIEPIVVNNDVNKISANNVALGLQEPLFFVEDSETACVIGCSAQTEIPSALSGKWDNASDVVIANSAQWAEGTEYEAGDYISIDNNTISVINLPTSADVQNIVDVATSGLMPSGDYLTKESADTLYAPTGNYLTGLPDDLVYTADITGLATTAELDEKLDKSDSGNFYPMDSNPSGYLTGLPSDLATTGFVAGVSGDITALIPTGDYLTKESADTLYQPTGQYQSALDFGYVGSEISSINGSGIYSQGGTANPQIPVTSTSGISIFESGDKVYFNISADYAFTADLTGKQDSLTFGYHDTAISSINETALYDNSAHARINTLAGRISDLSSNKLDSAIYANDSGTFLTAHQDISNKLDTTAFSDVSGSFLTAVPDTYLQNTDLTISDGKVTEISGVPLSAGGGITYTTGSI